MAQLPIVLRNELADYVGFRTQLWQAYPAIFPPLFIPKQCQVNDWVLLIEQQVDLEQYTLYSTLGRHTYNMRWLEMKRLCMYAEKYGINPRQSRAELSIAINNRRNQIRSISWLQEKALAAAAHADWPYMMYEVTGWLAAPDEEPDDEETRTTKAAKLAAASGAIRSLKYIFGVGGNTEWQLLVCSMKKTISLHAFEL